MPFCYILYLSNFLNHSIIFFLFSLMFSSEYTSPIFNELITFTKDLKYRSLTSSSNKVIHLFSHPSSKHVQICELFTGKYFPLST